MEGGHIRWKVDTSDGFWPTLRAGAEIVATDRAAFRMDGMLDALPAGESVRTQLVRRAARASTRSSLAIEDVHVTDLQLEQAAPSPADESPAAADVRHAHRVRDHLLSCMRRPMTRFHRCPRRGCCSCTVWSWRMLVGPRARSTQVGPERCGGGRDRPVRVPGHAIRSDGGGARLAVALVRVGPVGRAGRCRGRHPLRRTPGHPPVP